MRGVIPAHVHRLSNQYQKYFKFTIYLVRVEYNAKIDKMSYQVMSNTEQKNQLIHTDMSSHVLPTTIHE